MNLKRLAKAVVAALLVALLGLLAAGATSAAPGPGDSPAGDKPARPSGPLSTAGSAFTYQGRLQLSNNPANGQYDFQFSLYDALTGGSQVGTTLVLTNQTVTNGLFTVQLDFGAGAFQGSGRWLEIAVRQTGGGSYTTLSPRQPLTAAPYAASLVPGATITGTLASGNLLALLNSGTSGRGLYVAADDTGVYASSAATNGKGVYGESTASFGWGGYFTSNGIGVLGSSNAASSVGAYGVSNGSNGDGVLGRSSGSGGTGVYGASSYTNTTGVYGEANSGTSARGVAGHSSGVGVFGESTGGWAGIYGQNFSATGSGVYGLSASGTGCGVYGTSTSGPGTVGVSDSSYGVWGQSNTSLGVYGSSTSGTGVYGYSDSGNGLSGTSSSGRGVYGQSTANTGVYGSSDSGYGTVGESNSGYGVYGLSSNVGVSGFGGSYGVTGYSDNGYGVYGADGYSGAGVYGADYNGNGYAGYFFGNVRILGTCCSSSEGTYQIDHPLDPANKYLNQSAVVSPDMLDVINGNVTTDADGEAVVTVPDWFQSVSKDYRYQLTILGDQFAQARVSSEIKDGRFTIKTDKPNIKVSWQVTGTRNDPYARQHPVAVEQAKPANEQGKYLHPELYDQPESKGIDYDNQQKMKQLITRKP